MEGNCWTLRGVGVGVGAGAPSLPQGPDPSRPALGVLPGAPPRAARDPPWPAREEGPDPEAASRCQEGGAGGQPGRAKAATGPHVAGVVVVVGKGGGRTQAGSPGPDPARPAPAVLAAPAVEDPPPERATSPAPPRPSPPAGQHLGRAKGVPTCPPGPSPAGGGWTSSRIKGGCLCHRPPVRSVPSRASERSCLPAPSGAAPPGRPASSMSALLETLGFFLGTLGWGMLAVTLFNSYWRVSTVSGNVITTSTLFENLWQSCATDSTGVYNCWEFQSLLELPGESGRGGGRIPAGGSPSPEDARGRRQGASTLRAPAARLRQWAALGAALGDSPGAAVPTDRTLRRPLRAGFLLPRVPS